MTRLALFLLTLMLAMPPAGAQPLLCPETRQSGPPCDPWTTPDRTKCGAELRGQITTGTAAGKWRAWWYLQTFENGQQGWCKYIWASLDRFTPSPAAVLVVLSEIEAAPTIAQGIGAASVKYGMQPAAGSQDEFDFRTLAYAGCQALVAAPPANIAQPPTPCIAPTPPAPPADVYRTPANPSAIYPVVGGKRATPALPGRFAPADALCDCLKFRQDLSAAGQVATYCALKDGPATECTLCRKPPP